MFHIRRAWFYCKACHEGIKDETQIKKCKCKNCKLANPRVQTYRVIRHLESYLLLT